jgi:hypothetical protein
MERNGILIMRKKLFNITQDTTFKDVDEFFDKFVVTGVTPYGEKRFTMAYKSFAMADSINLYRGRVWGFKGNKKQLLKTVWN